MLANIFQVFVRCVLVTRPVLQLPAFVTRAGMQAPELPHPGGRMMTRPLPRPAPGVTKQAAACRPQALRAAVVTWPAHQVPEFVTSTRTSSSTRESTQEPQRVEIGQCGLF